MTETVHMSVELAGCPTACMHCHSLGKSYAAMPLDRIARVLECADRVRTEGEVDVDLYPMHEVLAHPDAAEVLRSFVAYRRMPFEPLPTTGVPLATRPDWRDLLGVLEELGTTVLWFTFHGIGSVHDRQVNREGAFEETCTAVTRARDAGLECGCNVFLTQESVPQVGELLGRLQDLRVSQSTWQPASYAPVARLRKLEEVRPELDDLLPLVDGITSCSPFQKDQWDQLEDCTEAAYVQKALASDGGDEEAWTFTGPTCTDLVCRPSLDLHLGRPGVYGRTLGSLAGEDGVAALEEGVEAGPYAELSLWFDADTIPSVRELAAEVGDAEGRKVYFRPASMRYRWLDLALKERRRH